MTIGSSDGTAHDSELDMTLSSYIDDAFSKFSKGQQTNFETVLNHDEEQKFQTWKQQYAPNDSGFDYDFRGAFLRGFTPDPQSGHWPDTFKKPNHPTFSDQSIYYKDAPGLAGSWDGEQYTPGWDRKVPLEMLPSIDNVIEPPQVRQAKTFDQIPDFNLSSPKTAEAATEKRGVWNTLTGADGKPRYKLWPERAVDDVLGTIKTFMTTDPGTPENSQASFKLAFDLGLGGLASLPAREAGSIGIFGGYGAMHRMADLDPMFAKNLEKTWEMSKAGADPREIFKQTGIFKGEDNMVRFEINDSKAKLKDTAIQPLQDSAPPSWAYSPTAPEGTIKGLYKRTDMEKLGDVLDHPELFKFYPDLAEIKLADRNMSVAGTKVLGTYFRNNDSIYVADGPKEEVLSTLLHELQHAIQEREGMAKGGNPKMFEPQTPEFTGLMERVTTGARVVNNKFDEVVRPMLEKQADQQLLEYHKAFDRLDLRREQGLPVTQADIDKVSSLKHHFIKIDRLSVNYAIQKELNGERLLLSEKKTLEVLEKHNPAYLKAARAIFEGANELDTVRNEAFKKYEQLYGEFEARLVQGRQRLDTEARRNEYFQDSPEYLSTYQGKNVPNDAINYSQTEAGSVVKNAKPPQAVNDNGKLMNDIEAEYAKMYQDMAKPNLKTVPKPETAKPAEAYAHYRDLLDQGNRKAAYAFEEAYTAANGKGSWAEAAVAHFKESAGKPSTILERDLFSMEIAVKTGSEKAIQQVLAETGWKLGNTGIKGKDGWIEFFDPLGHPQWIQK